MEIVAAIGGYKLDKKRFGVDEFVVGEEGGKDGEERGEGLGGVDGESGDMGLGPREEGEEGGGARG